jgi:hypothetical protein
MEAYGFTGTQFGPARDHCARFFQAQSDTGAAFDQLRPSFDVPCRLHA